MNSLRAVKYSNSTDGEHSLSKVSTQSCYVVPQQQLKCYYETQLTRLPCEPSLKALEWWPFFVSIRTVYVCMCVRVQEALIFSEEVLISLMSA